MFSFIMPNKHLMLNVTYYARKPGCGWSLERVFDDVAAYLPDDISVTVCHNRFISQGLFKRSYDLLRAPWHQGQVNHVTGDIHYISYALRKQRTILTILDCVFLDYSKGLRRTLLWFFWLWLPVRRCTVITAISEATRQEILQRVTCDPAKVRVIHCPVSAEFQPVSQRFNSDCPRVLHIGTGPNKNLERHVAALQGLPCELVVVGRLSVGQRRCLEDSGVHYTALTGLSNAALVEQYQLCDLVLFASTYEGFGLPIVEAQAVGRPVITSHLWSMPEVAGDAACLVDPFDVTSIRAGIERVFYSDDYRTGLVARGYENIQRFAVKTIAAQYAALYREVACGA